MILISKNEIYREGRYSVFLQPLQTMAIPIISGLEALGSRVGLITVGLDGEGMNYSNSLAWGREGGVRAHMRLRVCLCVRPPGDSQW